MLDTPPRVLPDPRLLLPNRPSLWRVPKFLEPAGASGLNSMRPGGRRSDFATRRACLKGPSPELRTPRPASIQIRGPRLGTRREQALVPAHARRAGHWAAAFAADRARTRNDRLPRDGQIGRRYAHRRAAKT